MVLCAAVSFWPWAAAAADDPFVDFSDTALGYENSFLQQILGQDVEELPEPPLDLPPDEIHRNVWHNNNPVLEARTTGVTLRFLPEPAETDPDGESPAPDPVEVKVEFTRRGIVVHHHAPLYNAHAGGVIFSYRKQYRDFRNMFVHGKHGVGIGVFVPEAKDRERHAAMLCLRDVRTEVHEEGLRKGMSYELFEDSRYTLQGAQFHVEGKAEGRVLSGHGVGLARALVLTSKNVVRSKPYFDENYSEDPAAFVEYYADPEGTADWTVESKLAGGIRAVVELQNAVGYKRIAWQQDVLRLRKLSMPQRLNIRVHKGWGVLEPGICHIIFRERLRRAFYSKEPVVIPDGYLLKEVQLP